MVVAGAVILLVLLGGSLSVTIITGGVVFILAFVAGVRLRYLVLVIATGLLLFGSVILISPTRMSRFTSFLNAEQVQAGDGYQLWHSLLALGSGGWRGLGFTQSRMKKFYLPEAHTDFIVSIVGEELGYLWVALLILTYVLLTFSVFWVSGQAMDREGSLICAGVGASLGLHAFVNLSVVSGMLPTTGVTAPFVSYGGSSILASGIGIGLVLSVSRLSEAFQNERDQQISSDVFHAPPPPPKKLFA
jgi:cell division protein FtsW